MTSNSVDYEKALSVIKKQVMPTMARVSLPAQKLLALVLAQVNPKLTLLEDMRFRIRVDDYQTLADIKSPKVAWKHMKMACKELESTRLDIAAEDILPLINRVGDGKKMTRKRMPDSLNIGVVDYAAYYTYDKEIEVMFTRSFEPYIVQVSAATPYNRDKVLTTLKISNDATMRFYRKLLEFASNKRKEHWWKVSIDDFKVDMGLGEDSYIDYRNLRRRVIEPALSLLNQHSEFDSITVETSKKGRKIVGLLFKYQRREQLSLNV
ncbi:MAG: replication initiation protein [Colwellia sp.]